MGSLSQSRWHRGLDAESETGIRRYLNKMDLLVETLRKTTAEALTEINRQAEAARAAETLAQPAPAVVEKATKRRRAK
jgi:hypothetical protein